MLNFTSTNFSTVFISHCAKGWSNATMNIREIRLANLRLLLAESADTQAAFCQRCDIPQSYLSQILNGTKSRHGKPRGIGDQTARKLEKGMKKPEGWMDTTHKQGFNGVKQDRGDYAAYGELSPQALELARLAEEAGLTDLFFEIARKHIDEAGKKSKE